MDLSGNTSLVGIAEAVGALQQAATRLGLEVFVVGALARDLWLAFGAGIDTGRKTEDADFAVACADWEAFDALGAELAAEGFTLPDPRVSHRFRHPNATLIDLIPFGGVEGADRTIAWPPEGDPLMNVLGFREVADAAVPVGLPGDLAVPVVPLHALALLKLVAWDDRRRRAPRQDAADLRLLLQHYFAWRAPGLADAGAGLLERYDYDENQAGAELLGRDIAGLASGDLQGFVSRLLERETDPGSVLELAREINAYEPTAALPVLRALRAGLEAPPDGT